MSDLTQKHCVPCEGGTKPLSKERAEAMMPEIPDWKLANDGTAITRTFVFKTFVRAIDFVREVADIAEMEDHHPDIHIFYNKVTLDLSTHAIKGLSENDFILAAKINTLPV